MNQAKKELKKLQKMLNKITDNRRLQGKRHEIGTVVLIVVFGIISNYHGLNAIGDFIYKNTAQLKQILRLKRLPSVSTIRRVLIAVKMEELKIIFEKWVMKRVKITKGSWFSLDGKAICGTSSEKHKETTIVSMFLVNEKITLMSEKVEDKSNEIPMVQQMIEYFEGKGHYFTADAMHCQKETVNKIVDKKDFYVLQVKNNQKNLYRKVKFISEHIPAITTNTTSEKNRGRHEVRTASVHNVHLDLEYEWKNIKHIVRIKRTVTQKRKTTEEVAYFITNADLHAKKFNKGIRGHWAIENSLHYVKDVTLREDNLKITSGNAPQNISIIRSFVLNILRMNGFVLIASTLRRISSDFSSMLKLFAVKTDAKKRQC